MKNESLPFSNILQYMRSPLINRKKKNPTLFDYSGHKAEEETQIQIFKYNEHSFFENNQAVIDDVVGFENPDECFWLNMHGLYQTADVVEICKKLQIHNLTVQSILDVSQRSKFQEYDTYSYLSIKSIVPSDTEFITEQISFVFNQHFLLSFQERRGDHFEHLRDRIRENLGLIRTRGLDYLLFTLLEAIVENYFTTLEGIDKQIEKFDFINQNTTPSPKDLEAIEEYKRLIHFIKKAILPVKEFTSNLQREEKAFFEDRHLKYFIEIQDLCLTLIDTCDILQTTLESKGNLFFSIQGHKMNQVMKTLTVVSTIFIPLTFVAGIYGMNFTNMPELSWKYGYAAVWFIIVIILIGMLTYFKRKNWF